MAKETYPLKDKTLLLAVDAQTPKSTLTNDDNSAAPQSLQPLTLKEFLFVQAIDTFRCKGHAQVGHYNFEFNVNTDGLPIERFRV